jgi:hypothetical protein
MVPTRVSQGRSLSGALMPLGAQVLSELHLHQLLGQDAYPLTQKIRLVHTGLAQHLSECHSQFVGHRVWLLSSDLDNRDENHPMAVRVNSRDFYTALGTLPTLMPSQRCTWASVIVVQAFCRGGLRWLWLAIVLHAAVDFAVAAASLLVPLGDVASAQAWVLTQREPAFHVARVPPRLTGASAKLRSRGASRGPKIFQA